MLLRLWSVCGQSSGSTQQPVPQEMGTQTDVPLDPCGNGHAQPHRPQCSSLTLCAQMLPQPLAACIRAWGSCSGVLDFRCCPPGASWATLQEVPQEESWKGLALKKCLALFFPSFQFLAAWGPGTPWTTRWEATVQELEN